MKPFLFFIFCSLFICGLGLMHSEENDDDDSSYFYSSEEEESQSNENLNEIKQLTIEEVLNTKVLPQAEMLKGEELVKYVNKRQTLWKAEINKFNSYSRRVKIAMLGVRPNYTPPREFAKSEHYQLNLPESFDSRVQWSNCRSIFDIQDQSSCGNCWALGAVSAMSDRICIASGGRIQVLLSANDLMSCCVNADGCNGGSPIAAWDFWVSNGIVSGSNYTRNAGCKPYPFPPCDHGSGSKVFPPCQQTAFKTPNCEESCQSSFKTKTYYKDKFYGTKIYAVNKKESAIQKELFTRGPVEMEFHVYDDFYNYKSGIYIRQSGKFLGIHAVRLIGWGTENDVPYWIVANSWNYDWGDNGYFRIVRGRDECGIESRIIAGTPYIGDIDKKNDDDKNKTNYQQRTHQNRRYKHRRL